MYQAVSVANYQTDLPDKEEFEERLKSRLDFWRDRNAFIEAARVMSNGLNPIEAPKNTKYRIKVLHTYLLASAISEKAARFTQQPVLQVIPENDSDQARAASTDIENALTVAFYEMERRGDGDVWSRVVLDAILLDTGVERIERAPASFWPEALQQIDGNWVYVLEGDEFIDYKKEKGIPIRTVYVPLENWFPVYQDATLVESFELERRSLRSLLRNYPNSDIHSFNSGTDGGLTTQVTIVHYVNSAVHAYYAMAPAGGTDEMQKWPEVSTLDSTIGNAIFLKSYNHDLGQSIYNVVAGRYGGWKTQQNRIEPVTKGMMELNQAADEIMSQIITNQRAKYWPTMVHKINPEFRPPIDGAAPKPISIQEGEDVALYIEESLEPLFKPVEDPTIPWAFEQIQEQIARLGGSQVLFGGRPPGVDTGYQQSLQITQSEHLDDKIEQHVSIAAVERGTIVLKHIRAMDTEIFMHHTEQDISGRKSGRYLSIKPSQLTPLPRMDASVRKPRPVDLAASLRAAREASDERQGKGPLLSDDTIRETMLSIQGPDEEFAKIVLEREKNNLLNSGLLASKIAEALNLKLAEEAPPVGENAVDPALLEAMQGVNATQAPQVGGVSPEIAGRAGIPTGVSAGQSQPEANAGTEIAGAQ